ncbi:MAG: EamA family transporter [Clostridia bacterium]|nr:EamA family transporter [Clostridia bacterium]
MVFFLTISGRTDKINATGDVLILKKGSVFIFLAAVMWGAAGIFVKRLGTYGISPMTVVVFRGIFTVLPIGIFMLLRSRSGFKIRRKDIYLFAANGLFSIVTFNFCYYKAMALSTLSVAAVLLYTAPIFVMLISLLFFKEKISLKKIVALILAFSGCAFVSGVFGSAVRLSSAALCYGLLTGLGYALYTIFSNRLILRGYGTMTIIFYTFVFASAGSLIMVGANGQMTELAFNPSVWLWAFLMGMFNTVLPYILYTVGLKTVSASTAPIIATVEPVAATVVGLFYGEKLTLYGVIGITLVLSSVLILNIKGGEKSDNQSICEN